MKRILILAAATLAAAGCRLEFTTPAASRSTPAALVATFDFIEGDTRRLEFEAFLDPGTGDDGRLRTVPSDTLRIGSYKEITPVTSEHGVRRYRRTWQDAPDTHLAGLALQPPQIVALGEVPAAISFGVHHRVGAGDVAVALTDTIELVVAAGAAPSRPPQQSMWLLDIRSANGLNLRRQGTGELPSPLRVPADWLQWADGEPLTVQLSTYRSWALASAGDDYHVTLLVTSMLQWRVAWQ